VSGEGEYSRIVIDGVEQENNLAGDLVRYTTSSAEPNHFQFSPDGKHAVYLGVPGRKPADRYDKHLIADRGLCLDGKILRCDNCGFGTYGTCELRPFFTPDSKHLVWLAWDQKTASHGGQSFYDAAQC